MSSAALRLRQYQHQAIAGASPELLIDKLYELALGACRRGDRARLRAVLVELTSSLDLEAGGQMAQRLLAVYTFCLATSALGDLALIEELLLGLRGAWAEGVLGRAA